MILSLMLAAPLAAPLTAQDPATPRLATAQAQLDRAKEVKKESRGTKGAARVAALDRACAAFGAVMEYWPEQGALTAEAAFRQGEIHRTLGRGGQAAGAFLVAVEQGAGTSFGVRGQLEIGHVHRRAGEFPKAIEAYSAVLDMPAASVRHLNDAREWTGKAHFELEDWPAAAKAFRAWGDDAEGPAELVKAADLEARALLRAGQLAQARARLSEVTAQAEDLAAEPSKEGTAVRKALDRMKAPEELSAAEAVAAAATPPVLG